MIEIFNTTSEYNTFSYNNTDIKSDNLYYVKEDGNVHFLTNNIDGVTRIYDKGNIPSGTKTITENGENIDVSSYATAYVNVPIPSGIVGRYNIPESSDSIYVGKVEGSFHTKYYKNIEIDGIEQTTLSDTYPLTEGIHIIKFVPMDKEYVEEGAFRGVSYLTSIYIPKTIKTISTQAFSNGNTSYCPNLTTVTFAQDSQLTTINANAFSKCPIQSITFPNTLQTLGGFTSCPISYLVVPDSVTTISDNAFNSCTQLQTIEIGTGITSIGSQSFRNTNALTSITIHATTPPTLNYKAFNGNVSSCPIYVPAESVDDYKSANIWSNYSSRIQAIPSE